MVNVAKIIESSKTLARNVDGLAKRLFLNNLQVGKEPRIKVLRGFRGVGKTTALLQMVDENTVYFSMDDPLVQGESLYDIGSALFKSGFKTLLIDEIHYFPEWRRHTKSLYDSYPNTGIVLSGSAPLAFEPERRYEIINIDPLSLGEFYHLARKAIGTTEAWRSVDDSINFIVKNKEIHAMYEKYLAGGAFPIFFSYGEKTLNGIYNSINKSIREDAPFFARVDGEAIRAMNRTIFFLASSTLGEYSVNSLSNTLDLKKDKTNSIITLLEDMRILRLVRPFGKGAKLVRGEPKLMFYHPVMRKAVCNELKLEANIGAIREELAVFCFDQRQWKVNTIKGMKHQPDYVIEKRGEQLVVEIGGPSKKRTQLKEFGEKTLVITDQQLMALACF
ncbi:MAG: AAA family ATPase [Candidatus Micrarchaeota archaeon]